VPPHGRKHIVKLDVDRTKGQEARHQHLCFLVVVVFFKLSAKQIALEGRKHVGFR
jgi:hypothetical protein